MASIYKKFRGHAGFNSLVYPDTYEGSSRYIMNFVPDNYEEIKATGLKLKLDRNTNSYIRPRRDVSKVIKGEEVQFGAPKLFNADGTPFEMKYIPKGSYVEIKVVIFDAGKFGKGHRLEEVTVLELAEIEEKLTENKEIEQASEPQLPKKKALPF